MTAARPIVRMLGAAACGAAACALAACAATDGGPGAGTAAGEPGFAVLRSGPAPADAELRAADAEPLAAGTVRWAILPEAAGGRAAERSERTERAADGGWLRTAEDGTRTLAQDADGTVRLVRQQDAKDGSTTEFRPPLAIAPPTLGAAADFASDAAVGVTRGAVAEPDAGKAQRTMRIAGLDRVRTPLGEWDALRVETTFTMKVPFASLRRDTVAWVVRGRGPVAARVDERVLVMGIVPRDRHEMRVRMPAAQGDAR